LVDFAESYTGCIYHSDSSVGAGTFAEYIAVDSALVVKKPENISFDEAAGIPLVTQTTVQTFDIGNVKKDYSVLIHAGSGEIGIFAIQNVIALRAHVTTTTSKKNEITEISARTSSKKYNTGDKTSVSVPEDASLHYHTALFLL